MQISSLLRLPPGRVSMAKFDATATPGYPGKGKRDAVALTAALAPELSELQQRLFANGRVYPETARAILLILQGIDTAGKSSVIRHVISMVDPEGVQVTAFRTPTEEERAHPFLWRIRNAVPGPGMIGIFDRSHYESVLIARVDHLDPPEVVEARYRKINSFERELVDDGIVLIKCFLNVSAEEQRRRIATRLRDPDKRWKYDRADIDVRTKWGAYMEAYDLVLERCNTDYAPWFVVPADRKWYRNWAVGELLREHLQALDLQWPVMTFDVAAEEFRLSQTHVG